MLPMSQYHNLKCNINNIKVINVKKVNIKPNSVTKKDSQYKITSQFLRKKFLHTIKSKIQIMVKQIWIFSIQKTILRVVPQNGAAYSDERCHKSMRILKL